MRFVIQQSEICRKWASYKADTLLERTLMRFRDIFYEILTNIPRQNEVRTWLTEIQRSD